MSSTKRGGQRSPSDNYPTPCWSTTRFLEAFVPKYHAQLDESLWLEPGAGEGNMIYAVQEYFRSTGQPIPTFDAAELREECREPLQKLGVRTVQIGDFFKDGPPSPGPYDMVLTNPPFSLAMEFILRSLQADTRFVAMLLRLNYLGSKKRHDFFRLNAPDLYVIPNRPSFKGTGETDSIEYAWFVWDKMNMGRSSGEYRLLDLTPKEERQKEHARLKSLGFFPAKEEAEELESSADSTEE